MSACSKYNKDALRCLTQWLACDESKSRTFAMLATVNKEFNNAFHAKAQKIQDEIQYNMLKAYITKDLEHTHGYVSDPDTEDERVTPMHTFLCFDEEGDKVIHLCRGPGSSVIVTSELVFWENQVITCVEDWDLFSPFVGLPVLTNLWEFGSLV
jgi:hypothetical protein